MYSNKRTSLPNVIDLQNNNNEPSRGGGGGGVALTKSMQEYNLVRQRAMHLANNNPALYLQYINILGNPSIVERYLSETVKLQPVVRKPKERMFREVTRLGDQLVRLQVSYTKTKVHRYVTSFKTESSQVSKISVVTLFASRKFTFMSQLLDKT